MPKYNHSIFEDDDGNLIESWTDRSGHSFTYRELETDNDDDGDEGCAACGNPDYPLCKTSCPLYDD